MPVVKKINVVSRERELKSDAIDRAPNNRDSSEPTELLKY